MPPKGKKTKAEEALDFLSNLDNLDAPDSSSAPPDDAQNPTSSAPKTAVPASNVAVSGETPRASLDASRSSLSASRELNNPASASASAAASGSGADKDADEAASTLAFLEAQINQKRAPMSKAVLTGPGAGTSGGTPRSGTPQPPAQASVTAPASASAAGEPANIPSSPSSGGWGVSSFWSSATSALQSAQRVADEQYKKVRTEGVSGVTGQLEHLGVGVKGVAGAAGVDLSKLRKGAEERLGGIVKGVDLDKLRQDLVNTTTSTLTSILDTVAPPISAHETLELWLSHPMEGYAGVEGVIYRAWTTILEQTESGELIVVWSPPEGEGKDAQGGGRSINPSKGWTGGWEKAGKEVEGVKKREEENPKGRGKTSPSVPVTTVPIFLYIQPVLAPLPIPEPPILLTPASATATASSATPSEHLYFILTLQDPQHSLRFTTVSQPTPADWMDVEYERSEWVEERLVEVLRTSVEVIAQDYVATRMALKPSAVIVPQPNAVDVSSKEASVSTETAPPGDKAE